MEWKRNVCRANGLDLIRGGTVVVLRRCALRIQRGLFSACVRSSGRMRRRQMPKQIWRHWEKLKSAFCCASYTFYYYAITKLWELLIPGFCSSPGCSRLSGLLKPGLCCLSPACVCSPAAPVIWSEPLLSVPPPAAAAVSDGHGLGLRTQNSEPSTSRFVRCWFVGFGLVVAQTGRAGITL